MSRKSIHPSTMTGIKRLAKQIKAAQGLSHSASLDRASEAAGYDNFRHAQNVLPDPAQSIATIPSHRPFLTAYWRDRDSGSNGRETLAINCSAPWDELLTPAEIKSARGLGKFVPEGPDHLTMRHLIGSQANAREAVCHAARTMQFVAATRLRPSSGYTRAYPKGNTGKRVPAQDHVGVWFDAEKRYLIADEPYEEAAAHRRQERVNWCRAHGYRELKSSWPGMHNPSGSTRLYLLSNASSGVPLEPLIKALGKLAPPVSASEWNGQSAPQLPYFVSPGTIAKAEVERTKTPVPRKSIGQRNSVPYTRTLGGGRRDRRPKGRMSVEAHAEVGSLLKSVLVATYYRKGVYNRVDTVRCDLDEWVQREYNGAELPNEQFFGLYYQETGSTPSRSLPAQERKQLADNLLRVRQILSEHYPDSPPLSSMLKKVDAAITSLQTWGLS